MAGTVIRNRRYKDRTWLVPVPTQPFTTPRVCVACGIRHDMKTLHLRMDSAGETMVSDGVLALLEAGSVSSSYEIVARLDDPPPLTVGGN